MIQNKYILMKQHGDVKQVAELMGITRHNAQRLLSRITAKRHTEAIETLRRIIAARETLKNEIQKVNDN